jgi:hypothetical protein
MALTTACRVSWKTAITSEVWNYKLFVAWGHQLVARRTKQYEAKEKQQPKKSFIFNALHQENEHLMLPFAMYTSGQFKNLIRVHLDKTLLTRTTTQYTNMSTNVTSRGKHVGWGCA